MNKRLREVRKSLHLTQKEFGEKLGLAANTITNYENGIRTPMEQTLIAICREYNVNYSWLKEGIGDMFISTDDSVANRIDDLLAGENETAKALFRAFASLDDSDWLTVQKVIDELRKD